MTSVNRTHKNFAKQLLDILTLGGSAIVGGTVKATILDDTTTVDTEWDLQGYTTGLNDFTTLGELSDASAKRQTLGSLATSLSGTTARWDFGDPTWPALGSTSPNAAEHILIYVEESGAGTFPADCWPVALCDASFLRDGTDFTAVVPTNGLIVMETSP